MHVGADKHCFYKWDWLRTASFELSVYSTTVIHYASKRRHVVIRTLSLRYVLFWKAIFTWHPDLLEWVLGEFARIRLRFVFHRVFAGEGSGRDRNTGSFPVVLPGR